ncbi:unnamed protein product, partial [Prorocentrum cordatum]
PLRLRRLPRPPSSRGAARGPAEGAGAAPRRLRPGGGGPGCLMTPGVALERANPVCSAAVENFVHQRHHQSHLKKVTRHKSAVNNAWNSRDEIVMQAVRARVKKRHQQNEDRQTEIERENVRLLVRLHEIDAAGKATPSAAGPPTSRSRCSSQPAGSAAALRGAGSRAGSMVQEMRRIDQENQHILRRLRGAKSTVNVGQLKREAQEKEKLMRLRCEHQQAGWKADHFITRCASEGRLVPLAPVPEGGGGDSRPGSRGCAGRPAGGGSIAGRRAAALGPGGDAAGEPAGEEAADGDAVDGDAAEAQGPPPRREKTPLGGRIPAASRALCAELLRQAAPPGEEHAGGAGPAGGDAQGVAEEVAEEVGDAEPLTAEEELAELAAAKEAATRAFRAAEAVDVSSHELQYGYGDLVKRAGPARGQRAGGRAL